MFRYLIFLLAFLVAGGAYASLRVERRDMKLASQALLEKETYSTPVAADQNRILSAQATSASVVTTVTSFLAQPDVCRQLVVDASNGTAADVAHGAVTVTGTNARGQSMTEDFNFAANEGALKTGAKAFCSVTSIEFDVQDGASATFDVGVNNTLGVKRCVDDAGSFAWFTYGGALEATRPTISADATAVELNLLSGWNQNPDGSNDIQSYFVQNFRCLP